MRKSELGFTLIELLVSIAILVALVLLFSRLFVSASSTSTSGNKRMDTDGQVRPLFERFAVDFALMIKRPDVDFYGKGTDTPNSVGGTMSGNDQLAFYSAVPGYHPAAVSPSPISLVAYRIGAHQLERMAKALPWNGASATDTPIVYLPLTIAANWAAATNDNSDADYELIGPYVFRFEYYYVLKNGTVSVTPWNASAGHLNVGGLQEVAAVQICVAALDPKSRRLLREDHLDALTEAMSDFSPTMGPGDLLARWQGTLDATALPRPAISAVRLYERSFAISPRQ
jgi:prepilin-type N-terminal cleavage/methylation domain-containing protein